MIPPLGDEATGGDTLDVLLFPLGGERYALPLGQVREITRVVAITRLIDAPPVLEGVVDLRGELVPVLDLRALLGSEPKVIELGDELIFIAAGGRMLAFRTDSSARLAVLNRDDLVPAEAVVSGFQSTLALAQHPEGLVLLLDAEMLLPWPELLAIATRVSRCRGAES